MSGMVLPARGLFEGRTIDRYAAALLYARDARGLRSYDLDAISGFAQQAGQDRIIEPFAMYPMDGKALL